MTNDQDGRKVIGICDFCGKPATDREHIIARQFFEGEAPQKHDLPRVKACRECNGKKQQAEDFAGVVLPFVDGSPSSHTVLEGRLPRTLANNKKLRRELADSLKEKLFVDSAGKMSKRLVIELSDLRQDQLHLFYESLARGMCAHEFGRRVPEGHRVSLMQFTSSRDVDYWRGWIGNLSGAAVKKYALGEFEITFTSGQDGISSAWLLSFRGTHVLAVTLERGCSTDALLLQGEWKGPEFLT